jgi:hypothetical protein
MQTENQAGIRAVVQIADANYRHFDAFAHRQGNATPSQVAQRMVDRHLEARAKGEVLIPINAQNYDLASKLAHMAHVPVSAVVNECLDGLIELARHDDTGRFERLMERWVTDGTTPANKIQKAERVKAGLKGFLAENNLLGLTSKRNADKL